MNPALASALDAVANLCEDAFVKVDNLSGLHAISVHSEIKQRSIQEKSAAFYRSFIPLRMQMISLLVDSYRRYFKLALAHPRQTGGDPGIWAWIQLQPAVHAALEWMRDWYVLACDGESQRLCTIATVEVVPGQTSVVKTIPISESPVPQLIPWRAPAWLFGISRVHFGVGLVKQHHVPNTSSEEKLGYSHTRLLLKGAKWVFLYSLREAIDKVRNEEIAAAGTFPTVTIQRQTERSNTRKDSKRRPKGIEGLGPKKTDLSQYMHNLTEKQQLAFSLKFEYELPLAEIASRMERDRKTASEHIEAAKRKIEQARSLEKSKAHRAKNTDE